MGTMERISRLPDWPARMNAEAASAYMGISIASFLTRYRSIAVSEGGNVLWARVQLDAIIADQFGLGPANMAGRPAPVPSAPISEYDTWKASQQDS